MHHGQDDIANPFFSPASSRVSVGGATSLQTCTSLCSAKAPGPYCHTGAELALTYLVKKNVITCALWSEKEWCSRVETPFLLISSHRITLTHSRLAGVSKLTIEVDAFFCCALIKQFQLLFPRCWYWTGPRHLSKFPGDCLAAFQMSTVQITLHVLIMTMAVDFPLWSKQTAN